MNIPIHVPEPSGEISFGNFAEDLRRAFSTAPANTDPWLAVATCARQLAPIALPPEEEVDDHDLHRASDDGMAHPCETSKPTLEELASALIAVFEGPDRLHAFQDAGGVWTIGRGHTRGVTPGMVITHEQAVAFFAADQVLLLAMVADKSLIAAAAYVSFGYNCGAAALRAVLTGAGSIGDQKHTTDRHGVVEPGLVSRRLLERLLIEASGV